MQFADNSFDFIWTWGVIHHSADIRRVLQEMQRVLKPGGQAITMVYHRSFWMYYVLGGFYYGLLRGELRRTKSLNAILTAHTDGAIARYYSVSEWKRLASEFFAVERALVLGQKAEMIPLPGGKAKQVIMSLVPNSVGRLFTNSCQMGSFLVSHLKKAK